MAAIKISVVKDPNRISGDILNGVRCGNMRHLRKRGGNV
jgi:hypothetical protein